MSIDEQNIAITYFMDELENNNSELDIEELLYEIEKGKLLNNILSNIELSLK